MKIFPKFLLSKKGRQENAGRPRKSRGQSLVEFAISLPVLLLLFSGLVEFGFALNYYLSLLDATRETARYWSNSTPFNQDGSDNMSFYANAAAMTLANLDPLVSTPGYQGRRIILDPTTDDIIVTVYSRSESSGVVMYPRSGAYHMYNKADSMFDASVIASRFQSGSPNAGILVVEVDYNYRQVLALPWLAPFVPNPLLLRAYTIMPLSAAEPVEGTP